MSAINRTDVYAKITSSIIHAIEAGAGTFEMPWHTRGIPAARPVNVASSKPYRGINALALWAAAQDLDAPTGLWGTFKQWRSKGASVRRGEHATTIVFWKDFGPEPSADADPEEGTRRRFLARGYGVFNQCQVDGFEAPVVTELSEDARIARAEAFWRNLAVKTLQGGSEAFYSPTEDLVRVPAFAAFRDAPAAYSVRFHEGVHATSVKHRCDRPLIGRFGSEAYFMEELCAELGSALILSDLEISVFPRPDHAAYMASWLKVLRNDVSAIFTMASKAQAAVDWMHRQQPEGDG